MELHIERHDTFLRLNCKSPTARLDFARAVFEKNQNLWCGKVALPGDYDVDMCKLPAGHVTPCGWLEGWYASQELDGLYLMGLLD